MDDQRTIYPLLDAELDAVTGGRHGGGQGHPVEIVEISIGEIIAAASGNSTVTVNVAGVGSNTTTTTALKPRRRH